MDDQVGEQRFLLAPSDLEHALPIAYLQRAEDPDLHLPPTDASAGATSMQPRATEAQCPERMLGRMIAQGDQRTQEVTMKSLVDAPGTRRTAAAFAVTLAAVIAGAPAAVGGRSVELMTEHSAGQSVAQARTSTRSPSTPLLTENSAGQHVEVRSVPPVELVTEHSAGQRVAQGQSASAALVAHAPRSAPPFSWRDAGIGAAVALAGALLLVGTAPVGRRRAGLARTAAAGRVSRAR